MSRDDGLGVLQVSTFDLIGGAERVAWNLFQAYRSRGIASWLAVGTKLGSDPDVLPIPNRRTVLASPAVAVERFLGVEDFRFPGSRGILDLPSRTPDVLHCHNLHGGYFDLRMLPSLSRRLPVVLTVHDAWLLSGHCAHSFECERWKTGCGHCPDLTIDPGIRRDATSYNWRRKRRIFQASRVYVAAPCRWLLAKVEQSILASGAIEARVIPNGVDLGVFQPTGRSAARAALGISERARVALFAATAPRENRWKDYQTVRNAVLLAVERMGQDEVVLLALGQEGQSERIGKAEVRFVGYQTDPGTVARYFQAADVYLHAAKTDTFPNTILEAQACGTPVIATAVGGIPEQIDEGRTGFLVPPGDAPALAERLALLLRDPERRARLGAEAAAHARSRFDLKGQVDTYLDWYGDLVERQAASSRVHGS